MKPAANRAEEKEVVDETVEPDEIENEAVTIVPSSELVIRDLIYTVREVQVMLDSDLARLHHVEIGALNRAAKRNESRFPENFRFQLTREEHDNLMCQIGISSFTGEHGDRRKLPFVFIEQGVAMLSAILRSQAAIDASVAQRRGKEELHYLAHRGRGHGAEYSRETGGALTLELASYRQ